MEETFEQKVIRNIQGNFAVYKATEVIGDKSFIPNLEWSEPEQVDKFFMFAKNLGVKIIYITEGDEEDEQTQAVKNTILQVGFLYEGIMHHINYAEDEDDDDDEYEDDEDSDEYEYVNENVEQHQPQQHHPQPQPQPPGHHPAPPPTQPSHPHGGQQQFPQ